MSPSPSTLPRARHHTICDAGHMSPLTYPGNVNPFILDHLLTNSNVARHFASAAPSTPRKWNPTDRFGKQGR